MSHVLSIPTPELHAPHYRGLDRYERPENLVGRTPVLRISEPFSSADRGFWTKLEGFNPGGLKDRPALHMVERAPRVMTCARVRTLSNSRAAPWV